MAHYQCYCYIEEYIVDNEINAHLIDKETGKIVVLETQDVTEKQKFLLFLSQAKNSQAIMPTIFEPNGEDSVSVYGNKTKELPDSIYINIDVSDGGYCFV